MQFQIGMSKSAYARRRGVTPKAVRKAIASGSIAEAAYPDGSIDADLADRLWEQNTDPTQRRGLQAERAKQSMAAAEATVDEAEEPEPEPEPEPAPRKRPSETFREDPPRRPRPMLAIEEDDDPLGAHLRRNRGEDDEEEPEDGEAFGDNPTMLALAIKEKREKVRKLKLANDKEEGSLVSRGPTWNHFFAVLRQVSEAWQTWPEKVGPQIAGELGVDAFKATQALKDAVREHLLTLSAREATAPPEKAA